MRPEPNIRVERFRETHPTLGSSPSGANWGYFEFGKLRIVSSGHGEGVDWEHVSVSLPTRLPTWDEMTKVKALFWDEDETVVQFHPPRSEYVNVHPYCLHLWKPPYELALPPRGLLA